MISQEQLAEWERLYNDAPNDKLYSFIAAAREAVPALIAEVRALEAERNRKTEKLNEEADWLAGVLVETLGCPITQMSPQCDSIKRTNEECVVCWREAAKKWSKS